MAADDDAKALADHAIAKAKAEARAELDERAITLIERCYGDVEAAREIWNNTFAAAERVVRNAGP